MVDEIKEILYNLERCTENLSVTSGYTKEDFVLDPLNQGASKWFIFIGLSHALDTCGLIAKHYNFKNCRHQGDMLLSLRDNRIYPPWLADSLLNKLGLVSDYKEKLENIDADKLYDLIDEVVRDLRHFRKYVLEYVI
jgi:uncharacterized protein YutE (UPF0331/DUF86 family)